MKVLGTKFALPIASVMAVLALVGVQAMALSQSPWEEITNPAADAKLQAPTAEADPTSPDANPSTTPLVIPTDGPTSLPTDDDEYEDEDEDEYEDEEEDEDEYEDEEEDEYEDEEDDD